MSSRVDAAKFSPSRCLEVSGARAAINWRRCPSSRIVRHAQMQRANLPSTPRRLAAQKKSGQAPRGPKMKERSSRRPAAKRGNATVGPQQNPASGGVPARASNVRPNALHFIPDQRSFADATGISAARAHRITFASCHARRKLTGAQLEEDLIGETLQFGDAVAVGQQGDRHPRARALLAQMAL